MDQILTVIDNIEFLEQEEVHGLVTEKTGFQTLLEREVTIRYLRADLADDPRHRFQFIKDARTLASLRHPNIVNIYDLSVINNNRPYLMYEKPAGFTLEQQINRLSCEWSQLNVGEILRIFNDVAAAVSYLHEQRVLLHNLLPSDILCTRRGQTLLTSLGQSVRPNVLTASPTALSYTAPERLLDHPDDERSDVYSLGVLLYHMLCGRLPFSGNPLEVVGQKQVAASLPALENADYNLPCSNKMKEILRRATANKIEQRYADVASLQADVTAALSDKPAQLAAPQEQPEQQMDSDSVLVTQAVYQASMASTTNKEVAQKSDQVAAQNGSVAVSPAPVPVTQVQVVNGLSKSNGVVHHQNGRKPVVNDLPKAVVPSTAVPINELPSLPADHPLMPGRDDPKLQAAIPHTILVPMPE